MRQTAIGLVDEMVTLNKQGMMEAVDPLLSRSGELGNRIIEGKN